MTLNLEWEKQMFEKMGWALNDPLFGITNSFFVWFKDIPLLFLNMNDFERFKKDYADERKLLPTKTNLEEFYAAIYLEKEWQIWLTRANECEKLHDKS